MQLAREQGEYVSLANESSEYVIAKVTHVGGQHRQGGEADPLQVM